MCINSNSRCMSLNNSRRLTSMGFLEIPLSKDQISPNPLTYSYERYNKPRGLVAGMGKHVSSFSIQAPQTISCRFGRNRLIKGLKKSHSVLIMEGIIYHRENIAFNAWLQPDLWTPQSESTLTRSSEHGTLKVEETSN